MGYSDESTERIIVEIIQKHGFRHSKKTQGVFYKKSHNNETHFIDMRYNRMRIYGFEQDEETDLDREVMERLYGHIRKEIAAIGCADITQYGEEDNMAHRRSTMTDEKTSKLEERVELLERMLRVDTDEGKNIQLLITTIRIQQDNINNMEMEMRRMMMSEGLKNAFITMKNQVDEYAKFAEETMNPKKKMVETNTEQKPVEDLKEEIEKKVVNDK